MNNFCQNCGEKLRSGAKFCPKCGTKQAIRESKPELNNKIEEPAATFPSRRSLRKNKNVETNNEIKYNSGHYNGSGNPGLKRSLKAWRNVDSSTCMGRADYWWGSVYILLIVGLECGHIVHHTDASIFVFSAIFLDLIFLLFGILFIEGSIERLHDTGHNGWWVLVPILNVIFLLQPTNWSCTKWKRLDYSNEAAKL